MAETPWGKKVNRLSTTLSEEGYRLIKARLKELGLSLSEVLERYARNLKVDQPDAADVPREIELAATSKSMDAVELAKALVQKLEEEAQEVALRDEFIFSFISGRATAQEVSEFGEVVGLTPEQLEKLWQLAQQVQKKQGGQKINGV